MAATGDARGVSLGTQLVQERPVTGDQKSEGARGAALQERCGPDEKIDPLDRYEPAGKADRKCAGCTRDPRLALGRTLGTLRVDPFVM